LIPLASAIPANKETEASLYLEAAVSLAVSDPHRAAEMFKLSLNDGIKVAKPSGTINCSRRLRARR
jgi:hypothetical protein